ncbi:flap endonuclease-1 [Methanofollis aquaemaris]|uniref:Flap endonuclease 1 n=1 Tax=Methanofollis aquaemaris TaxID=126734 RepID=A0A8A3S4Q8_9EURY|nr:flap endonuclease-1 [Methanofollis aquaemaris]QSZ66594.1 flap endonuclease-1 [Methanofollis aquaemaris]
MGVALRDIIKDYRQETDLEEMRGVVAVDAFNALYQFLSIIRQPDGTPLMDRDGRVTSHLSGLFFRNVNFLEKGVRPVYVFDGAPPELKSTTVEKRREVRDAAGEAWKEALARGDREEAYKQARASAKIDEAMISSAKRLLSLMGIPCVQAPSEGEAQAAFMAQRGDVNAAASQDYDSLLFGAPHLVRNLTVSGKRKMRGRTVTVRPETYDLQSVLEGLSVTREGLVEIGILVGTDFNPGIRGIGPKTALKIVQKGKFVGTIREKAPEFDPEPIRNFFLDPPVTEDYRLSWESPAPDGVVEMLCEEYAFSEARVESALERLGMKAGQKTLDAWF